MVSKDHVWPFTVAACRSCSAPIIWTQTEAGKRMPLDARTTPEGNWTISRRRDIPRAIYVGDAAPELAADDRHHAHWATCPNADQHRRRHA